jgi:hypothetical protein
MALLGRRLRQFATLALALAVPGAASAQAAGEYDVKAAFLYNFTRFVDWPQPSGPGPFCIGIDGFDPFGDALEEAVKGRSANGRAIVIKRFKPGAEPAGCEIIFVSGADPKRLAAILAHLKGIAVLTVGDAPGFCANGGDIGFEVQDNKVKLQVNPDAAQRSRLQISSKLLNLATLVRTAGQ